MLDGEDLERTMTSLGVPPAEHSLGHFRINVYDQLEPLRGRLRDQHGADFSHQRLEIHLQVLDGELAGYLRLIPAPPLVRIGRVAVAAAMRDRGLARRLMQEALLFRDARYPSIPVVLTAQAHLVPFYQSYGFEATG